MNKTAQSANSRLRNHPRVDILILTKNEDGVVEATELSDVGELGELQALEGQLAD